MRFMGSLKLFSEFRQEFSWNADANRFWKYLDGVIKTVHKNQKQQLYYGAHTDETLLFLKA